MSFGNAQGPAETPPSQSGLMADMLIGAAEISSYLYGDPGHHRKVYHLAETTKLPVFRLGARLCARRSVLLGWIADQERRNGH